MKVLMTLAGAGYGMQEQNIPNAERKKKKKFIMYQSKNRHC